MNHDEYIRIQVEEHGQIKKPWHYRVGQRRAIDWFFDRVPKDSRILDLGCGDGTGVKYLNSLGYSDVIGIDLHPMKVALCRRMGLDVYQRDLYTCEFEKFDIIWSSHSFEHMIDPVRAMEILREITKDYAWFFFVLPYPDISPSDAHVASRTIGLDVDDKGETVADWFLSHGCSNVIFKLDDFREKEVWLECKKSNE